MFIAANWKAYVEDLTKAKEIFTAAKRAASKSKSNVVIAPPAPFIGALAPSNKSKIAFAAQDVSLTTGGAQTGESTAQAFSAVGASYAIIGHSERRTAGDTNSQVAEKLSHALAHGLTPILCVGERARDDEGKYLSFIREELRTALEPQTVKDRSKIIVAYEPIWAIGKQAEDAITPSDLAEMVLYIRKVLAELLPGKGAARATVLYGGSVEPSGARALAAHTGIDGVLVGHASANPTQFADIIKELS
jgi:triosephosphate isomerase